MSLLRTFRDAIRKFTVAWLNEKPRPVDGPIGNVAYRLLWSMMVPLDIGSEMLVQSLQAPWPGKGTPTALPLIGRSRGIARGQVDTDDEYGAKLLLWLDKWAHAGSQRQLAIELHEYLGNHPKVTIVNRSGHWVTVAADGTLSATDAAWDWDSISNPERAGYWWDMWIVIYPDQWDKSATWGDGRNWGERDSGIGHVVTRQEVDAVKAIIRQWPSAHTKIRTVIWTTDPALFDPLDSMTGPDGYWGRYSKLDAGTQVKSRNPDCRYWEP